MKKLIIWLTIFFVMNLIGCYYQEQMNPGDYTFDENDIEGLRDNARHSEEIPYYLTNEK